MRKLIIFFLCVLLAATFTFSFVVYGSEITSAIKALDPNRGQGKTIGVVAFFQANDWNRNY